MTSKIDAVTQEGKQAIKEMVIVGDWIKSCETPEQLDSVDNFLERKSWTVPSIDTKIVSMHYGIINGMILTIRKRNAYKPGK